MDQKQGNSVFSLGPFMDKMDFQPFNNGRVVVESIENLVACSSLRQALWVECEDLLVHFLLLTIPVKNGLPFGLKAFQETQTDSR